MLFLCLAVISYTKSDTESNFLGEKRLESLMFFAESVQFVAQAAILPALFLFILKLKDDNNVRFPFLHRKMVFHSGAGRSYAHAREECVVSFVTQWTAFKVIYAICAHFIWPGAVAFEAYNNRLPIREKKHERIRMVTVGTANDVASTENLRT